MKELEIIQPKIILRNTRSDSTLFLQSYNKADKRVYDSLIHTDIQKEEGSLFLLLSFVYLFILTALDLCCCVCAFSSCGKWGLLGGYSVVAEQGLLIAVASRCGAWAQECTGFCSCGTQAQLPQGMWDLLGPETELVSSTLAGGFLTTGPPAKSGRQFKRLVTLKEWREIVHYADSILVFFPCYSIVYIHFEEFVNSSKK